MQPAEDQHGFPRKLRWYCHPGRGRTVGSAILGECEFLVGLRSDVVPSHHHSHHPLTSEKLLAIMVYAHKPIMSSTIMAPPTGHSEVLSSLLSPLLGLESSHLSSGINGINHQLMPNLPHA